LSLREIYVSNSISEGPPAVAEFWAPEVIC